MAQPFKAKTNKETWLMRIGGESVWLKSGQALTVYGEDSGWGAAKAVIDGETYHGSVDVDDYDKV